MVKKIKKLTTKIQYILSLAISFKKLLKELIIIVLLLKLLLRVFM